MNLWHRSALRLLAPLTAVAVMVLGSAVAASASPVSGAAVRSLDQAQSLTTISTSLRQRQTARYLDAHEIGGTYDFNVVTRVAQFNYSQVWYLTPVYVDTDGYAVHEIMQVNTGRYLDAHEIGGSQYDFRAVTRPRQFDTTQLWKLISVFIINEGYYYAIQQVSSGRVLDSYTTSNMDYRVVTRDLDYFGTQLWSLVGPNV